jgi:hypothetical protein
MIIKKSVFKEFIISRNRYVTEKENKNVLKYIELAIKIRSILNVKIKVISVII